MPVKILYSINAGSIENVGFKIAQRYLHESKTFSYVRIRGEICWRNLLCQGHNLLFPLNCAHMVLTVHPCVYATQENTAIVIILLFALISYKYIAMRK